MSKGKGFLYEGILGVSISLECDWKNTAVLYDVMSKYLTVMNRITWQREKGRGAKTNWKNAMEDIWFGVKNKKNYYFNVDAVKQKPEKLIAKLILASCPENGIVFDPFLGSGTTSVVAKKLHRRYVGLELNFDYALLAEKRLQLAEKDNSIQGYSNGTFWERNTQIDQKKKNY